MLFLGKICSCNLTAFKYLMLANIFVFLGFGVGHMRDTKTKGGWSLSFFSLLCLVGVRDIVLFNLSLISFDHVIQEYGFGEHL